MSRLETTTPANQSSVRYRGPIWNKRQAWIFLGAVIAVLAGGLLAYIEITQPRAGDVESLAPIQVWSLWQDLRRGPDRHLTPPEKQFLDRLHMYHIWRMVFVIGIVTGMLLMIASYAIPAPRTSRQTL
jgi:UDP-N-acetylmuramyl pentapeptide phosphotransferase/UDP-N-acetylglucosamine-1-phosphate transferase